MHLGVHIRNTCGPFLMPKKYQLMLSKMLTVVILGGQVWKSFFFLLCTWADITLKNAEAFFLQKKQNKTGPRRFEQSLTQSHSNNEQSINLCPL